MKNTTIAFTCSLAGTLALLAINGGHATQHFGNDQRPVEAMLKHESGHHRIDRATVEALPGVQVANVTSSPSAGSAQRVAIAWIRDRH
jgi:hypothetical protein